MFKMVWSLSDETRYDVRVCLQRIGKAPVFRVDCRRGAFEHSGVNSEQTQGMT
jgi:hypothetical protein